MSALFRYHFFVQLLVALLLIRNFQIATGKGETKLKCWQAIYKFDGDKPNEEVRKGKQTHCTEGINHCIVAIVPAGGAKGGKKLTSGCAAGVTSNNDCDKIEAQTGIKMEYCILCDENLCNKKEYEEKKANKQAVVLPQPLRGALPNLQRSNNRILEFMCLHGVKHISPGGKLVEVIHPAENVVCPQGIHHCLVLVLATNTSKEVKAGCVEDSMIRNNDCQKIAIPADRKKMFCSICDKNLCNKHDYDRKLSPEAKPVKDTAKAEEESAANPRQKVIITMIIYLFVIEIIL